MEVLKGIYRIQIPQLIEEEHGGCILKDEIYWFLVFDQLKKTVGFYGSRKEDYRRYCTKKFDYKGDFTQRDSNIVEFSIFNRVKNENVHFSGSILENGRVLKMKTSNESAIEKLWVDDELFEWLDLDYKKLEKEFGE
jgi:hypothetical protein